MNNNEMKDTNETGPGSPATDKAGQAGSGEEVISPLVQCLELANQVVTGENDYSKQKTVTQLRATITEKDEQLKLLATEFLKQNTKVKRLQRSVVVTTKKLTVAEQSAREHTAKSEKLTEALMASSLACSALSSMSSPKPGPAPKEEPSKPGKPEPEPAPAQEPEPELEPRSLFDHREYQDKVRSMNLDELDMNSEANSMCSPEMIEIDDGSTHYQVPMHLMGVVMGRQKVTLNRIVNQSKTEIEPLSWVVDGVRVMGFTILGSDDAIRHAVTLMIDAVRKMQADRAKKLLSGHLRSGARRPNQGPSGPSSAGSKSAKLCDKYAKGKCPAGNKCRYQHKKNSKK